VSVLFADLVGFTALSEDRDAEEVREFLSRYFDTARRVIDRFGGTVEKFIGDAVMAVWGTPVARGRRRTLRPRRARSGRRGYGSRWRDRLGRAAGTCGRPDG
jgi:class 3 adenylate cyclase